MEPGFELTPKQLLYITGMIWIAFIGAIAVLIIDWKIKTDVLTAASQTDTHTSYLWKMQANLDEAIRAHERERLDNEQSPVSSSDDHLHGGIVLDLHDAEMATGIRNGKAPAKPRTRRPRASAAGAPADPPEIPA